jgi:tripartite-type tricarboxylate transporter receptor subunit TctC
MALLLACMSQAAPAQQPAPYPSRPIRLVVPYVAGGTMDFIGHLLGQKIAPSIGQNLFIENRGGAGGAIGTAVVARAAPDGYTALLTSSSHAALPAIVKSLPYDPVKDFAPVTLVARSVGSVLVVHPSLPTRTLREFIALARAQPGALNYGSGGVGNVMHFAAESFSLAAGVKLAHVPYKGSGQVVIDLTGGRIELGVISAAVVAPHIRSGKLRALGITATERWSALPDVPTMQEAGLKGYSYVPWYGLWFPAATPPSLVARLRSEVAHALDDAKTRTTFLDHGLSPAVSTPQEFASKVAEDIDYHRKLAARIGLVPE